MAFLCLHSFSVLTSHPLENVPERAGRHCSESHSRTHSLCQFCHGFWSRHCAPSHSFLNPSLLPLSPESGVFSAMFPFHSTDSRWHWAALPSLSQGCMCWSPGQEGSFNSRVQYTSGIVQQPLGAPQTISLAGDVGCGDGG